jgi:hypothetical protein
MPPIRAAEMPGPPRRTRGPGPGKAPLAPTAPRTATRLTGPSPGWGRGSSAGAPADRPSRTTPARSREPVAGRRRRGATGPPPAFWLRRTAQRAAMRRPYGRGSAGDPPMPISRTSSSSSSPIQAPSRRRHAHLVVLAHGLVTDDTACQLQNTSSRLGLLRVTVLSGTVRSRTGGAQRRAVLKLDPQAAAVDRPRCRRRYAASTLVGRRITGGRNASNRQKQRCRGRRRSRNGGTWETHSCSLVHLRRPSTPGWWKRASRRWMAPRQTKLCSGTPV